MSHIKLTVDGRGLLDGDLGSWIKRPPEELATHLRPGASPPPWIKAAMVCIADAATTDQARDITITTQPGAWTMSVTDLDNAQEHE